VPSPLLAQRIHRGLRRLPGPEHRGDVVVPAVGPDGVFGADLLVQLSGDGCVLGGHGWPVGRNIGAELLPIARAQAEQYRLLFRGGDSPQPDDPRHHQIRRRVGSTRGDDAQLLAVGDEILDEPLMGERPPCLRDRADRHDSTLAGATIAGQGRKSPAVSDDA
jgi:hypothetical protein